MGTTVTRGWTQSLMPRRTPLTDLRPRNALFIGGKENRDSMPAGNLKAGPRAGRGQASGWRAREAAVGQP
eukprot:5106580-Pyramimonas_sp.AAC.1